MNKRKYRFGLQKRLVVFTSVLALITYSTSAFFIYVIYPFISERINEQTFVIITLLLGIIWSGILAYFAATFITKPLQRLENAAIRASSGDIREDVVTQNQDDEINSLAHAFNQMLGNLRHMIEQIDENFQKTNQNVLNITEKTQQATIDSENNAQTLEEISQGAESSAMAIQATAEAIDDISKIAIHVQKRARTSEKESTSMLEQLAQSNEQIQSLVQGVEHLANENRLSLQSVEQLEIQAKEVEQIIQLVGNIAKQTNLLALNASIEAARAGEQGKGFAVVAEEVRKLADQSAEAVEGISTLIHKIQIEVGKVVTQISTQVEIANKEAVKGKTTNQMIEQMAITINDVAESVKDIAQSVDQQMESVQQTSMQSQEVAAISEETSAGSEEVAKNSRIQVEQLAEIEASTKQLKEQADKLKDTISLFHI